MEDTFDPSRNGSPVTRRPTPGAWSRGGQGRQSQRAYLELYLLLVTFAQEQHVELGFHAICPIIIYLYSSALPQYRTLCSYQSVKALGAGRQGSSTKKTTSYANWMLTRNRTCEESNP